MDDQDDFATLEAVLIGIFEKQLRDLLIHRYVFQQVSQCTEPYVGTERGAILAEWMTDNYVAFTASAVRRMVDTRRDVRSLSRFLMDLKAGCQRFSRERMRRLFVEGYPTGAMPIALRNADELFDYGVGQTSVSTLTKTIVEKDIEAIKKVTGVVTEVANSWIAHTSRHPVIAKLNFGDLHYAIDKLQSVFERYYALLTGRKHVLVPLIDFDCLDDLYRVWPPIAAMPDALS